MPPVRPAFLCLLALVLLAGCGQTGSSAPTGPGWLEAERTRCVEIINGYRAQAGVSSTLQRWSEAEPCADSQAQSDSATGKAHGAFGRCGERAQNECPGWGGTPSEIITRCLQMMYDEGPGEPYSEHGHYINMTNTGYTMVACGFYQTSSGEWWALQDFR